MGLKDSLPVDNSKTLVVVMLIIVLVSGFLLFTTFKAKETEKKLRVQKEQELSVKMNEALQAQTELAQLKKEKSETEAKFQSELATLEASVEEAKAAQKKLQAKLDAALREKAEMAKLMDANTLTVSKLNKKIDKLEQEKEDLQQQIKKAGSFSSTSSASAREEDGSRSENRASFSETPANGGRAPLPEVVDLGQIVLHGASNEAAKVEHVNSLYGFIVVSAGSEDGLRTDSMINISRDNRFIAKAIVKKVRGGLSTALIVPEWSRDEIRVGDVISTNLVTPVKPNELPKLADLFKS
jgi:uncharacterized phage infection (PIP) family protein YhgE